MFGIEASAGPSAVAEIVRVADHHRNRLPLVERVITCR